MYICVCLCVLNNYNFSFFIIEFDTQKAELFRSEDFAGPCRLMTTDWDKAMYGNQKRRKYWDIVATEAIKRNKTLRLELAKFGVGNANESGWCIP